MRKRLTFALLLLVAAAAVGAGCGGDGNGGGGEALSAEEFRQQADAICTDFDAQIEELGTPEDLENLSSFIDEALPIIEEGFGELEQLQPPEELEEDWNRVMEVNRENLELTRELRDAAEAGNQERIQEIVAQAEENEQEADRLARELGLENCGNDGGG